MTLSEQLRFVRPFLSALYVHYLISPENPWEVGVTMINIHFTDMETESQSGSTTHPGLQLERNILPRLLYLQRDTVYYTLSLYHVPDTVLSSIYSPVSFHPHHSLMGRSSNYSSHPEIERDCGMAKELELKSESCLPNFKASLYFEEHQGSSMFMQRGGPNRNTQELKPNGFGAEGSEQGQRKFL